MRHALSLFLTVAGTLAFCGCQPNVVTVAPGEPVKLAEDVKAKVAYYGGRDANGGMIWTVAPKPVTLPQGYLVVPPPATQP